MANHLWIRAIKKYYNLQTLHEIENKLRNIRQFFFNLLNGPIRGCHLRFLACTMPVLYSTAHSTLCTVAQHPSSKTRPILTSSPGLWPAQTLGEMVARMRGRGGWRLLAPAPTSGCWTSSGPSLTLTSGQTYESITKLIIFCPGVTRPSCILTESSLPLPPAQLQSRAFLTKTNIWDR